MYNEDMPTRADLPTSAQLMKSTFIALVSAVVLLITVVQPSEYGIDVTGIGKVLGLTEMGEIKEQLTHEAAQDKKAKQTLQTINQVQAAEPIKEVQVPPRDEINITLIPGQGAEVKLVMNRKGMKAFYEWTANGGAVNFDTHGEGLEGAISYKKGRSIPNDKGELISAFAGNHGWYWRNRTMSNVTVSLKTWGEYQRMVRVE